MDNDFEVNEHDLDGEWLRQAMLYNKWADRAAVAAKNQAKLHLKRKILKASLYKEAKIKLAALPGSKEGKEPTGAAIEAEIRTSKEYESLSLELIDAEEYTSLMDSGKWSMVEKSKALDRLCVDRDKGFYMPSSCGGQDDSKRSDIRQEQLKKVDKGLREGMAQKKISRG